METELKQLKCKRCGYSWITRTNSPRCCPKCKSYDWDKPKKEKEIIET